MIIVTAPEFLESRPGRWTVRAMFRCEPETCFSHVRTWAGFRMAAHEIRDRVFDDDPRMDDWVDYVRTRFPAWSSGERALALAVLHAVDYDWLADELSVTSRGGAVVSRAWEILGGASGDFLEAVAACIKMADVR